MIRDMGYEIKIKKGESTAMLPAGALAELLSECSEAEIKALVALSIESDAEKAAEIAGLDSAEFSSALSFWRGAKIVGAATKAKKKTPTTEQKTQNCQEKGKRSAESIETDDLPEYSSRDVKRICDRDELFRSILDEAQQTFGKVFNAVEMNYMIAMRDHLGLDGEYILMLLEYFRREGKPLCYVVRVADTLVKAGVSDPLALEEYLKRRDSFKGSEGKYRDLFGIGTRALTAYEEKYFASWSEDMKMPFELVRLAFERTVEKKGAPQKNYINGILKSWHEAGLSSVSEVEEYESKRREEKTTSQNTQKSTQGATGESTFDIDEFFSAALERTYGTGAEEKKNGKKE